MEIGYLADNLALIDTLAQWHFDEWKGFRRDDSVASRRESLLAQANRRAIPTVLVALEVGEPCGSATLAETDLETRRDLTPWMCDVFIAPKWRRRGIASQLVRRIVREAQELGVPELYLFTTGSMREQLYAGLGWSVIGRPVYLGIERIVMSIRL